MKTLAILVGVMGCLAGGLCAATNEVGRLVNPSFEEGTKLPTGWKDYQGGDNCAVFAWDKTTARTGRRSVYLRNEGDRYNQNPSSSAGWIGWVPIKESTPYRFTAWVKVRKGSGSTALQVRGKFKGADGKSTAWTAGSEAKRDTGNQWQQLTLDFTPPPGVTQMSFWLWNYGGKGDEVWFDDVDLQEIRPAAALGNASR
jgi:hypothetical protein